MSNLPAGFLITTIGGKRCTAVPRSATTITQSTSTTTSVSPTTAPAQTTSTTQQTQPTTSSTPPPETTTSPSPPPETTTSSTQTQDSSPSPSDSVTSSTPPLAAANQSQTTTASDPQDSQTPTTSQAPPPSTTSSVAANTSSTAETSSTPTTDSSTSTTSTESTPTSPPTSTSSIKAASTPRPSNPFNNQNGLPSSSGSISSQFPDPTSLPTATPEPLIVSHSRASAGSIVGGVIGGMVLIGLVAFILWFFRRRRRQRGTSLLTPLDGERDSFNGSDRGSITPEKFSTGSFGIGNVAAGITAGIVGFGASLKSKVARDHSPTPSVNLNRGNSQFLHGPIPQHSRNNSTVSDHDSHHTVKNRFNGWWEGLAGIVGFSSNSKQDKGLAGPFESSGMAEKQAGGKGAPDFSQLLRMNEHDLQLQAEAQQITLSAGDNPFSDPLLPVASKARRKSGDNANPFSDPIIQPRPKNSNTYIADVRRSRGQSTSSTKNNPAAFRSSSASRPNSRHQSALSRDSYRDTVLSSLSNDVRKGKGRSDPFDLERPELWFSSNPLSNLKANTGQPKTGPPPAPRGTSSTFPDPLRMSAVGSSVYSSGVPSLAGWGGPGPDLGPGSMHSSQAGGVYAGGAGIIKGSLSEMDLSTVMTDRETHNISPMSAEDWDSRRAGGNTSPISVVSKLSSSRGVGRAM